MNGDRCAESLGTPTLVYFIQAQSKKLDLKPDSKQPCGVYGYEGSSRFYPEATCTTSGTYPKDTLQTILPMAHAGKPPAAPLAIVAG